MLDQTRTFESTNASAIKYMSEGGGILRIGHVWFGWDDEKHEPDPMSTVAGLYTFSNKQVTQILPVRSESALAFASTMSPIDTITAEIIVNRERFEKCVMELNAGLLASRILPVANPVISMVCMWNIMHIAKNLPKESDYYGNKEGYARAIMALYAKTQVMMSIEPIVLETMDEKPYELRMVVTMKSVLTVNSLREKQLYLVGLDDAIDQHVSLKKLQTCVGDTPRMDAVGSMFGANTTDIRNMINIIRRRSLGEGSPAVSDKPERLSLVSYHTDLLMSGIMPSTRKGFITSVAGDINSSDISSFNIPALFDIKTTNIARVLASALRRARNNIAIVLHDVSGPGPISAVIDKMVDLAGGIGSPTSEEFKAMTRTITDKSSITFSSGKRLGSAIIHSLPGKTTRITKYIKSLGFSITAAHIESGSKNVSEIITIVPLNLSGYDGTTIPDILTEVRNSFLDDSSDIAIFMHADLSPSGWMRLEQKKIMTGWIDATSYAFNMKGNYFNTTTDSWEIHDRIYLSPGLRISTTRYGGYDFMNKAGMPPTIPGEVNPANWVPIGFMASSGGKGAGFSTHRPIETVLGWKSSNIVST